MKLKVISILAKTIIITWVCETLIMFLLRYLPAMNQWQEAAVDSSLLGLMILAPLWLFVVKPIQRESSRQVDLFSMAEEAFGIVEYSDKNGNFKDVNDNFCNLTEYSKEEVLGKPHSLLKSGFHSDEFYKNMWTTLQSGHIWQGDICNKSKTGGFFWVKTVIIPILNRKNQIEGFFSVRHDVTEHYQTLKQLDDSKERMEIAFKKMNFSLFDYDLVFNEFYIDKSVWSLLGSDSSLYSGSVEYFKKFIPTDDLEILNEEFRKSFQDKKDFSSFFHIKQDSGALRILRVEAKLDYASDNTLKRIVGVIWDITQEKENEMKLHQSSKMSSLGQMASGVAHEINNPLAIISGKAQISLKILKRMNIDEGLQKNLETIYSTSERIAKIVKSLMSFSADQSKVKYEKISLNQLIQETIHMCRSRFDDNNIRLDLNFPQEDLFVECQSVQISQVLLNLLNNAFDAAIDSTEKWVNINLRDLESSCEISVEDSGRGIPFPIRDKIYLPFFTTKSDKKAIGLGLSTCDSYIKAHSGHFYLDPHSAHTRFVIQLPKSQSELTSGATKVKLSA